MPTGRTNQKALCVYCGSREGGDPAFTEAALALAELLVRENCRLIYGGGNVGLMGVVARRHLALGGTVTGVIPDFLRDRELALESVTEMIVTASMHARKQRMFDLSDGFLVLPGGIGTLDEAVEMLTWHHLRQHRKPLIFLDINGYWQPLLALFEHMVKSDFMWPQREPAFSVVPSIEDLSPILAALESNADLTTADGL